MRKIHCMFVLIMMLFATGCTSPSDTESEGCDFMLLDGEGPNAGGAYSEDLGFNTVPILLGHDWKTVEPGNDRWKWDSAFPDTEGYEHVALRIGIIHILAWSPRSELPAWLDPDNRTMLRREYGEYVEQAMVQVKERNLSVDLFLVELESNIAGTNMGWTNTETIEWIDWEVDLIKSVIPDARVCIPLTPTDLRPGQVEEDPNDRQDLLATEFAQRMVEEGVDFDVVGFNIASGVYDDVRNWTDVESYLEEWDEVGKDVFVWAMGYPADNDAGLPFNYPHNYSEEWQEEMYVNSLRVLMDDPDVIGATLDLYDYQEPGWEGPFHWGLVAGNRSEPSTLEPRPSYYAVKQLWEQRCP